VLKLSAGVDEADIGYIRPNMHVTFTVDAYGTQQFAGTVDAVRLNATAVNNVVTYPVWINVMNPDLKLRPSMTANLKIIVDQASNVVKVPNQALRFRPTSDMYTWLGMTPPAAGRGGGANARTDARGGRAGEADTASMATQGQTADDSGSDRRGRGGFGRGGRGANRGQQSDTGVSSHATAMADRDVAKIDDLFEAVPKRLQAGQVWIDDEGATDPNKRLRQVNVRLGLTDGQFSELVSSGSGTLTAGMLVVTGIVPPPSALPKPGQNIFQQNPRGGFGPGGFGPGGRGD
jgi:HlyD family secretion protein